MESVPIHLALKKLIFWVTTLVLDQTIIKEVIKQAQVPDLDPEVVAQVQI